MLCQWYGRERGALPVSFDVITEARGAKRASAPCATQARADGASHLPYHDERYVMSKVMPVTSPGSTVTGDMLPPPANHLA